MQVHGITGGRKETTLSGGIAYGNGTMRVMVRAVRVMGCTTNAGRGYEYKSQIRMMGVAPGLTWAGGG